MTGTTYRLWHAPCCGGRSRPSCWGFYHPVMVSTPVVATKLFTPARRPQLVARLRVVKRLGSTPDGPSADSRVRTSRTAVEARRMPLEQPKRPGDLKRRHHLPVWPSYRSGRAARPARQGARPRHHLDLGQDHRRPKSTACRMARPRFACGSYPAWSNERRAASRWAANVVQGLRDGLWIPGPEQFLHAAT